jgi:hypothetical protein
MASPVWVIGGKRRGGCGKKREGIDGAILASEGVGEVESSWASGNGNMREKKRPELGMIGGLHLP